MVGASIMSPGPKLASFFLTILLIGLFGLPADSVAGSRWYVYENCRLIENQFNDGDSFHVRYKTRHHIFRLYFVDAPETDRSIEGRTGKQAEYFGIEERDALRVGREATRFTEKLLAKGFTVYSKREDARGRSDRKRYFGMVKVGNEWLSEQLVNEGLARIYGMNTELPSGLAGHKHVARLKAQERAAQRNRKGAWGLRKVRISAPPGTQ